jgi:hypothetical protein
VREKIAPVQRKIGRKWKTQRSGRFRFIVSRLLARNDKSGE